MSRLPSRFPVYSRLLKLYPAAYRRRYGQQMLQTLADMLDDKNSRRLQVWLRTAFDLPLSLVKQNAVYLGGIMAHQTPHYVKRNATFGALLLVPFFVVIISNILAHPSVANSKSWIRFIFVGIVVLPALAYLIAAGTFLAWARQRRRQNTSFWRSLFDLRHNWPLLGVAALGFLIVAFVFGHDSVHCLTGNPLHEAQRWRQTWQCLKQG